MARTRKQTRSIFMGIFLLLAALVMMAGCSRKVEYVTIEKTLHDTVTNTQLRVDSLIWHDSIYIKEMMKGDTMFITEYRDRSIYKPSYVHDSVYISHTDSIQIPVQVEKQLTRKEKVLIKMGKLFGAFLVIGLVFLAGWITRYILKLKKII